MKLTTQQVANLNVLADFMDTLNAPDFTMSRFSNYQNNSCNTPACALGWACTISKLQECGLQFSKLTTGWTLESPYRMATPVFGDCFIELFSSSLKETIRSPKEWAAHCRAKLAEWGYANSPEDKFPAFMQQVLKPVKVEA